MKKVDFFNKFLFQLFIIFIFSCVFEFIYIYCEFDPDAHWKASSYLEQSETFLNIVLECGFVVIYVSNSRIKEDDAGERNEPVEMNEIHFNEIGSEDEDEELDVTEDDLVHSGRLTELEEIRQ